MNTPIVIEATRKALMPDMNITGWLKKLLMDSIQVKVLRTELHLVIIKQVIPIKSWLTS